MKSDDHILEQLHALGQLRPEFAAVAATLGELYQAMAEPARAAYDTTFVDAYHPGHFHTPLPSREEVQRVAPRALAWQDEICGVNLREREQLKLYASLVPYYKDMPFVETKVPGLRYHFLNDFFEYTDAFILYAMMRHFRPQRVMEAGSGYSSCVMLDTDEHFLENKTQFTFIEPYPERLLSNMKPEDAARCTVVHDLAQNVPTSLFSSLQDGDILFIDSSHVGKIGSDVLYFIFEVFPKLAKGVIIHIHDIFYPFEYPRAWYDVGRAWNEAYLLRAFLQYNDAFEILFFNHFMCKKHKDMFAKHTPVCVKDPGGSLWLRKVAD